MKLATVFVYSGRGQTPKACW